MLVWKYTPSGIYTSKSSYQLFSPSFYGLNAGPHQILSQQSRTILQEIWKCGSVPPRVQVFGWRLMRGAIATGIRATGRSTHIDQRCVRCGKNEDDFHLFFDCGFTNAVWFASSLGFRVEGLRMMMHYQQYSPSFGVFGSLEMIFCLIKVIAVPCKFCLRLKLFE
jgi:hypothetical protein